MLVEAPAPLRSLKQVRLSSDLAVIGGGLAGVCCAITAARQGLEVVLVQDRPVLGGNASSEVRLWILGATSHMGNNNRWAREGGVIDEILVENLHRNPEGNPLILDTILLEWVLREPSLTLLLNTAVHDLEKSGEAIRSIRAFCPQNATCYEISAPLFCDASGDGIAAFLAGAAFRIGCEAQAEFLEGFAPPAASSELLGHTIYFHSRDTGRPVRFTPPAFALQDITQIPRWRDFKVSDSGCRLWWLEWGGALDTIHDSETIKWELWKVAYGVWNHIKNSGLFPEADTLTLEWVGTIPGKRESRRFEGDHILTQQDIVEQRPHDDAVAYGGWAIDVHPVDGVFSPAAGCTQWHAKGIYPIPWRCLYSRNIPNLMLAGRILSASHVAFASTRVMATVAHAAQAAGMAAALCLEHKATPRDLLAPPLLRELQRRLLRNGQFIPGHILAEPADLARSATLTASSHCALSELPPNQETLPLRQSWAMMLPVSPGKIPTFTFRLDAVQATTLRAELRFSSKPDNHTPDLTAARLEIPLAAGINQQVTLDFSSSTEETRYAFVCLLANEDLSAHLSDLRLTGVLALCQAGNKAVAKSNIQSPPPGIGIDTFEFWTPQRRPLGKNLALAIHPPLDAFGPQNLVNGISRPTRAANAWVAHPDDNHPSLRLSWTEPQSIQRIEIDFDTDFDHPMESVLMGHPERDMPFCVQQLSLHAPNGENDPESPPLATLEANHHSRAVFQLEQPVLTRHLEIRTQAPSPHTPAALFAIRCYPGKS